ncbi:MAG: hypothetical protein NTY08_08820 [Proteobacteria bacterium]|nr:hypothetical protein [Pseudomonadota bacterium]
MLTSNMRTHVIPFSVAICAITVPINDTQAKPYFAEISTSASIDSGSVKVGDADEQSKSSFNADISWLFLIKQFEVGPIVSYITNSSSGTNTSALDLGPMFKWNFGVLGADSTVPFAYGALQFGSSQNTYGGFTGTYNGTSLSVGGGVNFMMGQNVSFQPRLERYYSSRTSSGGRNVSVVSSGFKMLFGISIFI